MTEEAANLIVLCCTAAAGLGIPALLPQPEPISAPVWSTLELAEGIPANQHLTLQPEGGVVLGAWWREGERSTPTTCYWLLPRDGGVAPRTDITEPIDGYTPRWPLPGVDLVTGNVKVECWNDNREHRDLFITIPEAVRSADFNGDGLVNTIDVTAFLNAWGAQRETTQ